MIRVRIRPLLASFAIVVSAFFTPAYSATQGFGSLLSGSFTPSGTFAQLSIAPAGFNVFNFTLSSNNLNSLFTNGAFIGSVAVNVSQPITASKVSLSNFQGTGVDGVFAKNGGGPGGGWEFRFDLGRGGAGQGGTHRLGANESASWTTTFNSTSQVQFVDHGFAMHVQGLTTSQGGSAWYVAGSPGGPVSAAPEPEIYAMMLSGLLFLGVARRRRKAERIT